MTPEYFGLCSVGNCGYSLGDGLEAEGPERIKNDN